MKKLAISIFFLISILEIKAQLPVNQGEKFKEVLRLIDTYYTDTTNAEKLTDAAIVKVLEELDPHSSYILAKDLKRSDEPLVANFEGVGITFQLLKDTIIALEIIPSGPAEKVGLIAGDRIVQINDTLVAGIKIDNEGVIKRLRGPKGTKVKVGILRKNDVLTFVITRDKIPIYSVDASYMVDSSTGYIKIARFSASTMSEYYQALDKLRNQGLQNLILDLQDNPGGYLKTAIDLSNDFLGFHELIVYTEGAHSAKREYFSDNKGTFKEGKLIVLVNEGSASASEIVSGCVQDQDRALVVGRRSFGKGLVQNPLSLSDGSVIRLTTAHYFAPSGRCIQRPYDKGKKDYYDEYSKRIKTGELFGSDTTHFPDSLLFYTKNKRKVFGGGGVVPDYFVPIDTNLNSPYYQGIRGKGILNTFTLEYADKNRETLKRTYPTADAYVKNFKVDESLLELLYKAGDKDSVKRDSLQMLRSKPLFLNQLKSLIARDLFDGNTFWRVTNEMNEPLNKAIEIMHTDKFAILNPPKKDLKKIEKEIKQKEKEKIKEEKAKKK